MVEGLVVIKYSFWSSYDELVTGNSQELGSCKIRIGDCFFQGWPLHYTWGGESTPTPAF